MTVRPGVDVSSVALDVEALVRPPRPAGVAGRRRSGMGLTAGRSRIGLGNLPTRLTRHSGLGAELGVDLWIKHEFEADAFGSGNKVRKLEFLLPALETGGYSGLVVDGTTQSNCAMALALYGPGLGYTVDLVLYGDTAPAGNYLDILRSGVPVTLLPEWSPAEIRRAEDRIVRDAAGEGRRVYRVPTGATNEVTAFGAIDLAEELAAQEERQGAAFDFVVFPTSSGGTQAGLEIGRLALGRPWKIIAVATANSVPFFDDVVHSIARNPVFAPLIGDDATVVRPRTYSGALGDGYGMPLPGSTTEIRRLRAEHGLVFDTVYTYKALVGLRQMIADGVVPRGSSVAFIHTGGVNERFLDLDGSGAPR